MEEEFIIEVMEESLMESENLEREMDKEYRYFLMGRSMRDSMLTTK